MAMRTLFGMGCLLTLVAFAAEGTYRDNLLGIWQAEEGDRHETWSLERKGDVLRVVRTEAGKVTFEAQCKTDGTDCGATDEGKKVTVVMYFNGPALVQMETRDTYVTTRKFSLDGGSGRMTIDVNPVTGPGKHYTVTLTRHVQASVR